MAPSIKFHAMITFEPGISAKNNTDTNRATQALISWTWLRPDVWRTRKAAKKDLAASVMYGSWDPRVLDLYVVCSPYQELAFSLTRSPFVAGARPQGPSCVTTQAAVHLYWRHHFAHEGKPGGGLFHPSFNPSTDSMLR